MKKITLLCLLFTASFLIFTQPSIAQVNIQGGVSGNYSQFYGDASGIGVSGDLDAYILKNVSAGITAGYHSYTLDKTDLSVYAVGKLFLKSQGFRPYVSLGYGYSTLSGTFTKGIWINNQYTVETFEDKTTSQGIRIGAGMLYPLSNDYSLNIGAFHEHKRELAEHMKFQIGISKLF
ncbi:MAG: outer membrane beta-barrel protein [Candidatus Marinimicrobia bacterium]|nr:outer membrane beta-barrel protein [Candidatus Neomarinimicrobiota bacterium]